MLRRAAHGAGLAVYELGDDGTGRGLQPGAVLGGGVRLGRLHGFGRLDDGLLARGEPGVERLGAHGGIAPCEGGVAIHAGLGESVVRLARGLERSLEFGVTGGPGLQGSGVFAQIGAARVEDVLIAVECCPPVVQACFEGDQRLKRSGEGADAGRERGQLRLGVLETLRVLGILGGVGRLRSSREDGFAFLEDWTDGWDVLGVCAVCAARRIISASGILRAARAGCAVGAVSDAAGKDRAGSAGVDSGQGPGQGLRRQVACGCELSQGAPVPVQGGSDLGGAAGGVETCGIGIMSGAVRIELGLLGQKRLTPVESLTQLDGGLGVRMRRIGLGPSAFHSLGQRGERGTAAGEGLLTYGGDGVSVRDRGASQLSQLG